MSAPAQTYFCGNGHIILELGHGEVVMFEDIPPCPHCDNKNRCAPHPDKHQQRD